MTNVGPVTVRKKLFDTSEFASACQLSTVIIKNQLRKQEAPLSGLIQAACLPMSVLLS
jgi:hypothetical protein